MTKSMGQLNVEETRQYSFDKSNQTRKEIKKVVIYARFSSDNQRDESIDAQQRACEEYAKRNGMIIVDTYIDRAKSATSDRRPEC